MELSPELITFFLILLVLSLPASTKIPAAEPDEGEADGPDS